MSFMLRTIRQEKSRIDYLINAYESQLNDLPKGSIVRKTVKGNDYFYLKYRKGKQVMTDYLGKNEELIGKIRGQLEKRRHLETMLSSLRSDALMADKILEGNV